MPEVIGISFPKDPKIYMFENNEPEIKVGDLVVVETERFVALGQVATSPRSVDGKDLNAPLTPIRRRATEEDLRVDSENREKEKEAFRICLEKIKFRELPMKLVNVEFFFDRSKIIFYFVADGRIDFRDLVKDLAHEFQTRIEMRQIGVRDEAKYFGGLGPCGREFCCSSVLHQFEPVSVRMAKEQNLALNPMKISGACGRLMCCLAYEYDTYQQLKEGMPQCGKKVITETGAGKVIRNDPINQKIVVRMEDGSEVEMDEPQWLKCKEVQGQDQDQNQDQDSEA